MNPGEPTESERNQLRRLHASAAKRRLYGRLFLLLNLLFLVYTVMFAMPSIYVLSVYALVLMVMIYTTLIAPLMNKCPRCKQRMTSLRGRCAACGLELGRPR